MTKLITEQQYYKIRNPKSKAKKVIASHVKEIFDTVRDFTTKPLKEMDVLDVGSGQGEYCFKIEEKTRSIIGVEPYKPAYEVAIEKQKSINSKVKFCNSTIEDLKIAKRFDLIICLTVIEHMPDAEKSFQKIFKLLKKDGVIYLTAPNKLWPLESHYKLLFLSWLPLSIANLYVRLVGRAYSYQDSSYSKTYFGMRSFFDQFPCEYKFVLPKNIDGAFLGCGSGRLFYRTIMKSGIFLIRRIPQFWIFSKGFIMIIIKD